MHLADASIATEHNAAIEQVDHDAHDAFFRQCLPDFRRHRQILERAGRGGLRDGVPVWQMSISGRTPLWPMRTILIHGHEDEDEPDVSPLGEDGVKSGEMPDEPVVSKKSGLLFERRLIERYIESDHGKCPVTKEGLTMDDIVLVKTNKVRFPGMLRKFRI
ncbi:hypothetical protein GUJ93_ZPchr0013g36933 [Zizania palustris]|uniref:Pre-mRNA-processing factor 19 n=1 Tax=Zizania palustris TaxID=103762 RepID=A0A8J5WUH2_ZIZPA|nr:hypothetical protein GUJ93_ZPchr0013g36933 [Zizania palustris]